MRVWARDSGQTQVSSLAVVQFFLITLVPTTLVAVFLDVGFWRLAGIFVGSAAVAMVTQLIMRGLHARRSAPRVFVELSEASIVRVGGGSRGELSVDLKRPHRARLHGDQYDSGIEITSGDTEIRFSLSDCRQALFAPRFADPRFVVTAKVGEGVELDPKDHEHAKFLDTLLMRIWNHRAQNRRYQVFSSFPWASGKLVDARPVRSALQVPPSGDRESEDEKYVAEMREGVKLWLDDHVGVSSDNLVLLESDSAWVFPLSSITADRVVDTPCRIRLAIKDAKAHPSIREVTLDSERVTSDHVECLVQFVNCHS